MLGFPILYFKGMRLMMFQLSGFHCKTLEITHITTVDDSGKGPDTDLGCTSQVLSSHSKLGSRNDFHDVKTLD